VQDVVIDGGLVAWAPPGTPTHGDIRQLEDAQDQLNTMRVHLAEKAIAARQALDEARAKVTRRLRAQQRPTPAGV
jgi:hypothetical protein